MGPPISFACCVLHQVVAAPWSLHPTIALALPDKLFHSCKGKFGPLREWIKLYMDEFLLAIEELETFE